MARAGRRGRGLTAPADPAPGGTWGADVLRVMTWNVWWRFGQWRERQPAIAQVLVDSGADLVGLNEVWVEEGGVNQAEVLGRRLGFHVAHGDLRFHEGLAFTNAVLSRWPIERSRCVRLPDAGGAPGHRQAVAVHVQAPWGPTLFVSTHLDWRFDASPTRQAQVAELCRLVAEERPDPETGYPAILTGDLNAVPHADEIRMLTGARPVPVAGLTFVDAWEVAGGGAPGHTWDGANPHLADAAHPNRRLDYVLVSWPRPKPRGSVSAVRLAGADPIGGVVPSDHLAVVADLRT